MRADFALIDRSTSSIRARIDRVFHRQDVAVLGLVDVVDHRRQAWWTCPSPSARSPAPATRLVGNLRKALLRSSLRAKEFFDGMVRITAPAPVGG